MGAKEPRLLPNVENGTQMAITFKLRNFKQFKSLLIGLISVSLLTGLGISPAKADGAVDVQLGSPALSAVQGAVIGDVDLTIQAADQTPSGQLYTITVTNQQSNSILVQNTNVTETQIATVFTVPGLPIDIDLNVVVTAQAWLSGDGLTNYLASDSNTVTVQAKGSASGFQIPTWVDETLAPFVVGEIYSDGVQAQSDTTITYTISSGTLPDGLSLDSNTGAITGTPTLIGQFVFEITAQTLPNDLTKQFTVYVEGLRGCQDYSNASFASNILLNTDGTPIGCDYESQPADLRPVGWDASFSSEFGAGSNNTAKYQTRLGYACDDCWVGGTGVYANQTGIPIGFDINFFGTTYSQIFINSNGSVTFDKGSSNYNQPLKDVLNGAVGLAPFAVDIDNRDLKSDLKPWGATRHADFFYWGRTTYQGKQAFVVTWMNMQIYPATVGVNDFSTFQVIILDNGSGDADYIINFGSLQDFKNNAGYPICDDPNNFNCYDPQNTRYLASGFGTKTEAGTLYASLQDETGYLYNGAPSATALDGGANALNQASLNSDVPGRFIFQMVSGYVPEVATVPSAPVNFAETNLNDSVTATWEPPVRQGGAPLTGYVLRYRLSGTNDAYIEVSTRNLTATINGLAAGNYAMQVAAVNEIGRGPFSRSLLVPVSGPVYADMSAYTEALAFAQSLNSSFFTPESWSELTTATSVTVTRTNTQVEVDAQTLLINTALANLVLISTPVFAVNYVDYNLAVAFANSLSQTDFTIGSWYSLQIALAVDVSTADQQTVDNQTALINTAINNLIVAANVLVTSDLTAYNEAVRDAFALNATDYSTSSWAVLLAALSTPITRQNSQAEVDQQTLLITNAIAALEPISDLSGYNLALADASQYSSATVTSASWSALQLALSVTITELTPQAQVDAATDAINAAIDALVFTANMTAYNAAVVQAGLLIEGDYTSASWALLQAAVAIQVSPLTDSQIFVDIATTNITSAITALVLTRSVTYQLAGGIGLAPTQADTAVAGSFAVALAPVQPGYTFAGWSDGTGVFQPESNYVVGASDIVFVATWTPNPERAISFTAGAGTGTGPSSVPPSLLEGQTLVLPVNTFTRELYAFAGWSDGVAVYQSGSNYVVAGIDLVFEATWTLIPVRTIVFSPGAGEGTGPSSVPSSLLEGQSLVLPLNTFTRVGYTFAGWSDGTAVHAAGHSMTVLADLSFVATWAKIVVQSNKVKAKGIVTGFKFEKSYLSKAMLAKMSSWAKANKAITKMTCIGYTGWNQNKLSPAQLAKLGKARANAVCSYFKKLIPNLIVKLAKFHGTSKHPTARRVLVFGR